MGGDFKLEKNSQNQADSEVEAVGLVLSFGLQGVKACMPACQTLPAPAKRLEKT